MQLYIMRGSILSTCQTFELQFSISDQLFLDVLLMKVRTKTISFAKTKNWANEEKEKEVENCSKFLEEKQFDGRRKNTNSTFARGIDFD